MKYRNLLTTIFIVVFLFSTVSCASPSFLETNTIYDKKDIDYAYDMLKYLSDTYPEENWTFSNDLTYSGIHYNYKTEEDKIALKPYECIGYFACSASRPVCVRYEFNSSSYYDSYSESKSYDDTLQYTQDYLEQLFGQEIYISTNEKTLEKAEIDYEYATKKYIGLQTVQVYIFDFDSRKSILNIINQIENNYYGFNLQIYVFYNDELEEEIENIVKSTHIGIYHTLKVEDDETILKSMKFADKRATNVLKLVFDSNIYTNKSDFMIDESEYSQYVE